MIQYAGTLQILLTDTLIKMVFIDPNSAKSGYYPELIFYLLYLALVSVVYGFFQEKYRRA